MATDISTELFIAHPPEAIWQVLTDFSAYPAWNPMAHKASGELTEGSTLELHLRIAPVPVPATIRTVRQGRELRWGGGIPLLLDIEHYFCLVPYDSGVRFIHGERFGGLLGPLLVRLVGLDERMYARFNRKLAERVTTLYAPSL
ncbi:MAG: SRPBCC domain-containing protein [Myxococcota bacterium]